MTLTPEQFNQLATKQDLEDLRGEMATKTELTELKSEILTAVDSVFKKLDNIEHAFVSNMAAHDRYEEAIKDLQVRVAELERKN